MSYNSDNVKLAKVCTWRETRWRLLMIYDRFLTFTTLPIDRLILSLTGQYFCFFFFTAAPAHGQDGDLYFSVSPAEHSVVEGLPVRLRCEAQPSSHVKYSWKIDGQPLAPSPRRHQVEGDLYITRVNRILDSGNFVCVATHEETGYSIESSPAKIDVQCKSYYFDYISTCLRLYVVGF